MICKFLNNRHNFKNMSLLRDSLRAYKKKVFER